MKRLREFYEYAERARGLSIDEDDDANQGGKFATMTCSDDEWVEMPADDAAYEAFVEGFRKCARAAKVPGSLSVNQFEKEKEKAYATEMSSARGGMPSSGSQKGVCM